MDFKIGVDLDDVLNNYTETYLNYLKDRLGLFIDFQSIRNYELPFCNEITTPLIQIGDKAKANQKAVEFIKRIKDGVFIITSRSIKHGEDYIFRTHCWLEAVGLGDIPVYFSEDKINKANELGLEFFIEDCPKTAISLAESGINVFLLKKPWNKNVRHKRIHLVPDWNVLSTILDVVIKFRQLKHFKQTSIKEQKDMC